MELKKIPHYIKRTWQLGLPTTCSIIGNRISSKIFDTYWRMKAHKRTANFSWKSIAQHHNYSLNCSDFIKNLNKRVALEQVTLALVCSKDEVVRQAQEYKENIFSILGSPKKKYSSIPWHTDIRLQALNQAADCIFDPHSYYKDVEINSGDQNVTKDIKVPWELSRLQHFFVLGYAYQVTGDEQHVQTFVDHYHDWNEKNPYLLGSHWSCPMDVGIRAANLVWAFHFFKNSTKLSYEFLEKFVTQLYDHFYYLQNNWEVYDFKTSNHYLSDLIGYFYCCYFFYDLPGVPKRAAWCHQELIKEFEKQIFEEGTDYEGSTAYHKLVTELFYHWIELAPLMDFTIHSSIHEKMQRMLEFIDWCTPHKSSRAITVGDNDSGSLLPYGISPLIIQSIQADKKLKQFKHYNAFGLSILKTEAAHCTLRHHAFNACQPSGHFHNDAASITLAINGIDIFVDPGSYLYTPSAFWRNKFRSVESHNTFFIKDQEFTLFDERLFGLNQLEQKFLNSCKEENSDTIILKTSHKLYKDRFDLIAQRILAYNQDKQTIIIEDAWKSENTSKNLIGCWNFILNPELTVSKKDKEIYLFFRSQLLALIYSSINLEIEDTFVSFSYGSKVATKKLTGNKPILSHESVITKITFDKSLGSTETI